MVGNALSDIVEIFRMAAEILEVSAMFFTTLGYNHTLPRWARFVLRGRFTAHRGKITE